MPLWESHLLYSALLSKWNVTCLSCIAHIAGKFAEASFSTTLLVVDVYVRRKYTLFLHPEIIHQSRFGEVNVEQIAVSYDMHVV